MGNNIKTLLCLMFVLSCSESDQKDAIPGIRNEKTCIELEGYLQAICYLEAGQEEKGLNMIIDLAKRGDKNALEFLESDPELQKLLQ